MVLKDTLPELVKSISFSVTMKWESSGFRFVRPVRWILALYNSKAIKFCIAGISSGDFTYGHRFLSNKPLKIGSPEDYFHKIKKNYVVLDKNGK